MVDYVNDELDALRLPIYDPISSPTVAPATSATESPIRVLCINAEWATHVIGVLQRLERSDAWLGDDDEQYRIQNELATIIARLSMPFVGDCPVNYPDSVLDGPATPNPNQPLPPLIVLRGGGVIALEELLYPMITKIRFDPLTCELIVESGQCCVERISLKCLTGEETIGDVTEGNPLDDGDPATVWTACGKVSGLIDALAAMIQAGLQYYTSPLEFNQRIRESVPGVNLGSADLYLLLFDFVTITKIVSDETIYNADLVTAMKCLAVTMVDNTPDVTIESFESVIIAVKTAIYENVSGVGVPATVWTLWEQCWQTIGAANGIRLMQLGATDAEANCDCPEPVFADDATNPTVSGWYWGPASNYGFIAPGGFNDFEANILQAQLHHVYGVAWRVEWQSGDPVLRVKRKNTPVDGAVFDVFMFGVNSDSDGPEQWVCQTGAAAWVELETILPGGIRRFDVGLFSDNVAAPVCQRGQTAHTPILVRAEGDPATAYGIIKIRFLHNTGEIL